MMPGLMLPKEPGTVLSFAFVFLPLLTWPTAPRLASQGSLSSVDTHRALATSACYLWGGWRTIPKKGDIRNLFQERPHPP